MRRPLRSWTNLLGKLGLQVIDKPANASRTRHTQRQLSVESLERRDLMATLYWDTNGSTPGLGGAGTWDLSAANWTTDATGSSATQAWNNAAGDDAVFSGTGASVTIGSGIQVSSLKIESSGYSLGSGSLAVNGTGEVNVATSISTTISSQLTGSTELLKTGAGTLVLSGSNTHSGGTQIDAGTLRLTNVSGAGTGTIEIGNGTLSLYRSGATTTYANAITSLSGTTGSLTVDGSGSSASPSGTNSTYATGTITIDGTLTVSRPTGGTGQTFFTGLLAGNGNLRVGNTNGGTAPSSSAFGRARFDNASNTFAGSVNVLSGGNFLNMQTLPSYLGMDVASGGFLTLLGNTTTTVGSLTGSGTITKSVVNDTATLAVGAGNVSSTFSGVIGQTAINALGTLVLTKIGTGTQTLSGTNTFSGSTTIDAGTLRLTNVSGAGTGVINIGNGTLSLYRSGATTTYANAITSLSGTTGTLTVDGSGTNAGTGTNTTYTTGTITVDGNLTFSRPTGGNGTTIFTGLLAGNGVLKVANTNGGVTPSTSAFGRGWFNNTANTFAGEVNVLAGGNFLNSSLAPAYTLVDIATGGYMTLRGTSTTTIGTLTGGGTITKSITADTATLSVGASNVSSTFSGVIGQTALNATGTVAFTKTGTGTLTLSGANTYTGSTTIDGGGTVIVSNNNNNGISKLGKGTLTVKYGSTLQVAGANALGTGSNKPNEVSVESGSTLTTANGITAELPHVTLNGSTIASGTPSATSGSWAFMNGINVEGITTSLITASSMYLSGTAPINIGPDSTLGLGGEFDNTPSRGASTYATTGDGRLFRYGELVLNRSFEQPNVTAGSHSHLASIPGWSLARGNKFEIQDNISGLGGASEGAQHLELDSDNTSSDIKQTLSVMPGSVYTVSFDYRGRPNRTTSDNKIKFQVIENRNGSDVFLVNEDIVTTNTTTWTPASYDFQALTDEVRIVFLDTGTYNSFGMFIDNVSCKLDLTEDPGVAKVSVSSVGEAGMEPNFDNFGGRDAGFVVTRESQPGSSDDSYNAAAGVAEQYKHLLTVDYEFADASLNPATFGTDYNAYYINEAGNEVALASSGTLTIPAGKQSVHVVIRPLLDFNVTEALENVQLLISKPSTSDPTFTIYTDRDETSIINYVKWYIPVKLEGGCPCACSQAESNPAGDATGSSGGSLLAPQSGTTPNIQTPAKIPSFPAWNDITAIRARLTLGSAVSSYVYYDPATVTPGDDVWLNLFVDASGETTGVKGWTIDLDYLDGSGNVLHADDFTGLTTVYNRLESEFGKRWWRSDLDQLVVDSNYATVFSANGQMVSFYINGSDFVRATASTEDVQLTSSGSNYLLSDKSGNQTLFNSAGRLLSKTTATGLVTTYAYNSGNPALLETVTTPDGDVTRYAYETYASGTKWRVATMIEHDQSLNSVTTEFTYNSISDNLVTQTVRTTADMTPVIKTETYEYDPTTSLLTEITDSEANTTTINYDFAGRIDTIERACGGTTAHDPFRSVGLVDVAVVGGSTSSLATFIKVNDSAAVGYNEDERGNPTLTRMDDRGRIIWEQDAQGNETTFTYDQHGKLLSMIAADPDGAGALESVETVYTYDAFGNRISQVERTAISLVVLSTQSWTYDPVFGAVTRSTDELGRVTKYLIGRTGGDINDDGRVLAEIRIVGLDDRNSGETDDVTTTYTYGSVAYGSLVVSGLTTSETDANGHTTTYEYFDNLAPSTGKLGLLQQITNPDLTFRTFNYDAHGNRTSETDELSRTTTYSYDGEDRLISRTDPDPDGAGPLAAPVTTYEYDTNDNMTRITDPLGRETIMVYNNRAWLAERIEEGGITTSYTYNCVGDMVTMTDPLGRVTTYAYDDLNRQISVTLPDPDGAGALTSPVMSTTYDALGRTQTTTDANGNVTTYGYDQLGRQTTVTMADPDGAGPLSAPVNTSVYNDAGQLISSIDALGHSTTYGYDDLGRQVIITKPDPDGVGPLAAPVMTTTYDKVGNVLTSTDALGNVTSYAYDDRDRMVSVTMADPDGAGPQSAPVMLTVYDDAGQVTSTTDALGRVTTYGYDNLGRRVSVTLPDPDGAGSLAAPVMTTVYDVAGQVASTTDALGNVTSYEYDDLGRQTKVIQPDPDGTGPLAAPEWTTVYDDAGQVISKTDPLGRTTTNEYDSLGRTISVTLPDPDGAGSLNSPVFTTTYDAKGNMLTSTDALGNVTSYTYDALNRCTLTTQADPDGAGSLEAPVWETVYDVASQVVASIDPLGRTTIYEYDDLGRRISVTQPDPDGAGALTSPIFTTSYDSNGNVLTSTDALGNITSYTYDALNRRTRTTQADPDGAGSLEAPVWETVYDVASQVIASIDPLGRTTTYEYDDLGRRTKATSPDPDGTGPLTAAFTVTMYDIMGNVLTTEDALNQTTSNEYDNLYRLIATTNANSEETTFTYDLVGNRLTLIDPNGNTTEWEYDDLNRVVLETNGLNKTRNYVYDVGSRLTSKIDRLGREVEYVYDNLNRVIEEVWDSVSSYTWTYDAAGQMVTGGNAATREYVYSYDALGRVTQIDTNEFGSSSVYDLNWTYDANGNRMTRTHAANTATWSYDFLNRAVDVAATGAVGTYGAVFSYNTAGQMTFQENSDSSVNSGLPLARSEYAYDGAGRLQSIAHNDASNNPFASYGYTWDASDRITAVDFLDGVYDNEDVDYAYDAAGQVTGADRTGSGTDENYDYDTNGNREAVTRDGATTTWGVGTNNQLTSDGTNSYAYDDEGNLTIDGVSTYYWDHRNRLIEVRTGSTGVMFTYDHNNLRVAKFLDLDGDWDYSDSAELDTQTSYYLDGRRMVREVSADGTVENNYLFGMNSQLIAVEDIANDVIEFAYNDHLGSVRDVIVVDAGTAVHMEHNTYDSFGRVVERLQYNGTLWSIVSSQSKVTIGYTSEYFDITLGSQYNHNRWYRADLGIWLSEDPIAFEAGDANLRRYVGNGSTNNLDPSGLDDLTSTDLGNGLHLLKYTDTWQFYHWGTSSYFAGVTDKFTVNYNGTVVLYSDLVDAANNNAINGKDNFDTMMEESAERFDTYKKITEAASAMARGLKRQEGTAGDVPRDREKIVLCILRATIKEFGGPMKNIVKKGAFDNNEYEFGLKWPLGVTLSMNYTSGGISQIEKMLGDKKIPGWSGKLASAYGYIDTGADYLDAALNTINVFNVGFKNDRTNSDILMGISSILNIGGSVTKHNAVSSIFAVYSEMINSAKEAIASIEKKQFLQRYDYIMKGEFDMLIPNFQGGGVGAKGIFTVEWANKVLGYDCCELPKGNGF